MEQRPESTNIYSDNQAECNHALCPNNNKDQLQDHVLCWAWFEVFQILKTIYSRSDLTSYFHMIVNHTSSQLPEISKFCI